MHDAAVALTDFALSIESILLAALLWRGYRRTRRESTGANGEGSSLHSARWFTMFFATVSLPSLLAGAFHGFVADDTTPVGAVLWRGVMLTIGIVAFVGANAAASLWPRLMQRAVKVLSIIAFVLYCGIVFLVSQDYGYAILIYLPATVFLLVSFAVSYLRTRLRNFRAGALGMILTFVAAGLQQSSASIEMLHLDHNALYHISQALALVLIYFGARGAVAGSAAHAIRWLSTSGGR